MERQRLFPLSFKGGGRFSIRMPRLWSDHHVPFFSVQFYTAKACVEGGGMANQVFHHPPPLSSKCRVG